MAEFIGHKDLVHALYYGLMHVWSEVFGTREISMRAPSALAVGFAVVGIVLLGARIQDLRLGVLAAAVFVVLPRTTYMGAEARSYAITAALAVWAVIALLWCSSQPRRLAWLVYAATIIAGTGVFVYSRFTPCTCWLPENLSPSRSDGLLLQQSRWPFRPHS